MNKVCAVLFAVATGTQAASALAQDSPPPYEKGPVWVYTGIKVKDGHFDEYMQFLDTKMKPESEALKQAGRILDYKILVVTDARKGEPDLYIAREYPNMAAFDHSTADDFALDQKVVGSIAKANQEQAARGSIRDVLGETMVREATLK